MRLADKKPIGESKQQSEGRDGSVFVATYRGLYKVNRDATRVRRVSWPGRLPGSGAGPLLRDGGTLWVAGLNDGLWQMDLEGEHKGRVRAAVKDPARTLTDTRISALARGPGGEIWIGTRNGLNRYDPARGEVHRIVSGELAGCPTDTGLDDETISILNLLARQPDPKSPEAPRPSSPRS